MSLVSIRNRSFLTVLASSFASMLLVSAGHALTGAEIWSQYQSNPNNHSNIPNNSYAGYRNGEVPLPSVPQVNSILDFGGNGNGTTDNTAAFKAAIANAAQKGGGAVFLPAGTYRVTGHIQLKESGVVLRGAGTGSTTIQFTRPLKDVVLNLTNPSNGQSYWSWTGGLIWVAPATALNEQGQPLTPIGTVATTSSNGLTDEWEQWRSGWLSKTGQNYSGPKIANVTGTASKGALSVTVDTAAKLKPGMFVLMTWKNDLSTHALHKHIENHALMDTWDYNGSPGFTSQYRWPVQISSISGNTVTLKQPLRLEVRSEFAVGFEAIDNYISEAGIENLKIQMVGSVARNHLQNDGYNGILFNQAINCWAKNIIIENAENGVFFAQTKNISVSGLTITGNSFEMHHATANRFMTADVLVENFTINSDVRHGINTEAATSGQVWSKGTMAHGTFDSHRNYPFDGIRTEISVNNDGGPGGANGAGPFNGKSMVHWNINITGGPGLYINQPDAHTRGALVGVRGAAQDNSCAWAMVCGDKGNLIGDAGLTPNPLNLHAAQLSFRKSNSSWVHISSHFNGQVVPSSSNQTLRAEGNANSGRSISRIDFYDGQTLIGTDTSSPYSIAWNGVGGGVHAVRAVLTDSTGATVQSAPISVIAGSVLKVQNTDPAITYSSGWNLWSNSIYNGGSLHGTCSATASADYSFRGTRIRLYTYNHQPDEQRWKIFLDNMSTPIATINVPRFTAADYLVWDSGDLADGNHQLRIMPNGNCVNIDYFWVISTGTSSSNPAPSVNITSPSNGAAYTAPASITINANASDSNGSVSSVQFLAGTTSLGTDTSSPYGITWSGVAAGAYSLTARATDNAGAVTTSGTVNVTVNGTTTGTVLYRINAGGGAVSPFTADANFSGGSTASTTAAIDLSGVTSPAPAAVYQTERYGNITYTLGSLTANTAHTVRLHFAETWHSGPGLRKFDVFINGTQVLNDYDVFAAAGAKNKAVINQFTTNANASGQIVIQFTTVVDNAKISGIEIIKN